MLSMQSVICGDGPMGRALAATLAQRAGAPRLVGRPVSGSHPPEVFADADVVFDFSIGPAVPANVEAALAAGSRRLVIGTTGWSEAGASVEASLRSAGAAAVVAANFSPGVTLFLRLAEAATRWFGPLPDYDPYVLEWHRRGKLDRPSGTAKELTRRVLAAHPSKRRVAAPGRQGALAADELEVTSLRAGAAPGMHLFGFDAAGETVELRVTARDRSAYAAGAIAAADWLCSARREPGIHPFEAVIGQDSTGDR
jgi:4-hydroxy-tetrahydrodipicolinate reductase